MYIRASSLSLVILYQVWQNYARGGKKNFSPEPQRGLNFEDVRVVSMEPGKYRKGTGI
jgi:hypothetical protein